MISVKNGSKQTRSLFLPRILDEDLDKVLNDIQQHLTNDLFNLYLKYPDPNSTAG